MPDSDEVAAARDRAVTAERDAVRARYELERVLAKERRCHWCGKTDEDNRAAGFGSLVDFTVHCANDEEGEAKVLRFACDDHLIWLSEEFNRLGFHVHAHGGACFLETIDCPAYQAVAADCPTPEDQYT